MSKLGIVAAGGNLVLELIDYVAATSQNAFVVAIENAADPNLFKRIDHIWIKIGEVGRAINAMKKAGVTKVVFAGTLKKPDLFSLKVDAMGAKLLAKIIKDKFLGDNKILTTVMNFIQNHGFEVVGVHEILQNLVVAEGVFSKVKPSKQDEIDIELGAEVIKQVGILDIGQAVIVQKGVVLGVEAIEGTDALIARCKDYKRTNDASGVLVKFSKPNQELKMDLPTIGLSTIKNVHNAGFKGIIIEANKTIFLNQKEVIEFADKNKMFIGAI